MHLLKEIIIDTARVGAKLQNRNGSMQPGHNGPHNDIDTPVRNTAHWCITFLKVYEWIGDKKLKKAGEKAANYLISPDARPMNAAFWCRENPKRDLSNGLIGQAWAMEALIIASKILNDSKYQKVAEDVFMLHPFMEKIGLWKNLNVDGSHGQVNLAFNQQLWFAIMGFLLIQNRCFNEEIKININRFFDKLGYHANIYQNGLLKHLISQRFLQKNFLKKIYFFLKDIEIGYSQDLLERAVGYHSFSLYGLAILKQSQIEDMHIWKTIKIKKITNFIKSESYKKMIIKNKYAFSYNPVGFENAFTLTVFDEGKHFNDSEVQFWINKQVYDHFCFEKKLMNRNTIDELTLSARIYEATRLLDVEMNSRLFRKIMKNGEQCR